MRRLIVPKITLWLLLFAMLISLPVSGQGSLGKLFDFTANIESLTAAADSGANLLAGRYVILTGTVRSIEANEGTPIAIQVELAAGQWIGTSKVVLRTVLITFYGESFKTYLDRESPFFLRPGNSVLAVARVVGVGSGVDGGRAVILEGEHLRRLDS